MKIEYTTGCICDAILIDGENEYDLTPEQRIEVISRIYKYIEKKGISLDAWQGFVCYFPGMIDSISDEQLKNLIESIPGVTFNNEYYYVDDVDKSIVEKLTDEERWKYFTDLYKHLESSSLNHLLQWFTPLYIGLKYLDHCECCGDNIESGEVNI